jgi:PqqD family protein of HPr-rel-A system
MMQQGLVRSADSDRPAPAPEVTAYPVDDELVLYDARNGQGYVLNPTAARIWSLCDGSLTSSAVAEAMSEAYALPYDEALSDVRECLDYLWRAGLITSYVAETQA